jgi:hypothetical protein
MDSINKRLDNLEKSVNGLINSLKKIEDVKSKQDLYSFSTQQLIKWLKDNEVVFDENIKDTLVDIVWTNLNEWEWDYYYEEESEESESSQEYSESSDKSS